MVAEKTHLFAVLLVAGHENTRHRIGLPPDMNEDGEMSRLLPGADILVMEREPNDSVILYRLTRSGKNAGDTWHMNIEDAKHQVHCEYGDMVGSWEAMPHDIADPRRYAVEMVNSRKEKEKSGTPTL